MLSNIRFYLGLLLGSGLVIWAGSFVPALTNAGGVTNGVEDRQLYEAAFSQELQYCRAGQSDVDCQCFANVAGVVIASEEPRVRGATYPDRLDLARWQAEDSC